MIEVERIFNNEFGWIPRSQEESDEGIDLHVEVCDKGQPTGRLLSVQVKTGPSFFKIIEKDNVAFPFGKTHYDYWMAYSLPVLVVLHNPRDGRTIWQIVSRDTCISTGKRWKVLIPFTQELSPKYVVVLMALAQKPTPTDAVKREQERIETLDPRFRAEVTATANGTLTVLSAKEDVTISLQISGHTEKIMKKYTDLIERGKPVSFEKEEIELSGSPLFERISDEKGGILTVQAALKRPVTLSLLACTLCGKEEARIDSIPATVTAGTKSFTISGGLHNSPLSITMEGWINPAKNRGKASIGFDPNAWFGKRLLQLSYFEQIHRLFTALQDGATLGFECYVEGNRLFSSVANGGSMQIENQIGFVDLVGKARFIARKLDLTPIFPELKAEQADELELLYKLLQEGEVTTDLDNFKFTCKLRLSSDFLHRPEMKKAGEPFQIALDPKESQEMPFLGNIVKVGPMLMAATSVVLSNRAVVVEKLENSEGSQEVELVFEGTNKCKMIRRIRHNSGSPHLDMDKAEV